MGLVRRGSELTTELLDPYARMKKPGAILKSDQGLRIFLFDGFVKSSNSVLRCILRYFQSTNSTYQYEGFARLAKFYNYGEAFFFAIEYYFI